MDCHKDNHTIRIKNPAPIHGQSLRNTIMAVRFNTASQNRARRDKWRRGFLNKYRNGNWEDLLPYVVSNYQRIDAGLPSLITDEEMSQLFRDYEIDYQMKLDNTRIVSHRELFVKAGLLERLPPLREEDLCMRRMSLFDDRY